MDQSRIKHFAMYRVRRDCILGIYKEILPFQFFSPPKFSKHFSLRGIQCLTREDRGPGHTGGCWGLSSAWSEAVRAGEGESLWQRAGADLKWKRSKRSQFGQIEVKLLGR